MDCLEGGVVFKKKFSWVVAFLVLVWFWSPGWWWWLTWQGSRHVVGVGGVGGIVLAVVRIRYLTGRLHGGDDDDGELGGWMSVPALWVGVASPWCLCGLVYVKGHGRGLWW